MWTAPLDRVVAVPVVLLLIATPLIAACSSSSDFAQVDSTDAEANVAIPSTTISRAPTPERRTPTTTPATARAGGSASAAAAPDAALVAVVDQLVSNPDLVAAVGRLATADPATLAGVFGLDTAVLSRLSLTLDEVQGLAAIAAAFADELDPGSMAAAFGAGLGGSVDLAVLHDLVGLAETINATALGAIGAITPQIIAAIVTTVSDAMDQVDPFLLAVLTAVLDHLDPFGLGALADDPSTGTVLAVFASAALRASPELGAQLRPRVAGDARLSALVDGLDAVGRSLDPHQANALVAIGSQMTPDALAALTTLISVLGSPTVHAVFGTPR